jgi:phosphatidylglycerophosphatase A
MRGFVGSCAALVAWVVFDQVSPHWSKPWSGFLLAAFFTVAGFWATREQLKQTGAGADADPQWIVIDEWAGVWLTLSLVGNSAPLWIAAGFLAFRVFDGAKPWPVSAAETLPGAQGVLLDDLVAAVCSWLAVLLIGYAGVLI